MFSADAHLLHIKPKLHPVTVMGVIQLLRPPGQLRCRIILDKIRTAALAGTKAGFLRFFLCAEKHNVFSLREL